MKKGKQGERGAVNRETSGDSFFETGSIPPLRSSSLPVYIHIPFCFQKCGYCDFYSVPLSGFSGAGPLLEAEIKQLDYFLALWLPEKTPSLYIGGGTPSVISPALLENFLTRLHKRLPSPPEEFTIEANPESLNEDFLALCAARGVTRISLGLQTFQAPFLESLGRRAAVADNRRALELLARRWKGQTNLDLMYGFPGQRSSQALADAEEALAAKPEHLSLYALTAEEGTPFSRDIAAGKRPPLNEDRQENIRQRLHKFLSLRGYENYEISNYALPGKECRHNAAYWNLKPYLGIGPAGVSTLPSARGPVRLSGIRNVSAFVERPTLPEAEILSPRDFLADYLLMGLRTAKGIDTGVFSRIFGLDFFEVFSRTAGKYRRFIAASGSVFPYFTLTDKGRRIVNRLLLDFFADIDALGYEGPLTWPPA